MNFISIKTLKRKGNVHTHTKSACSNRHSWSYSIQFLPQGSGWKVSSYNKHLGSPFVTGYICMFTCTCVYFALVLLSGNRAGSLQTEETNESQYHRARKREYSGMELCCSTSIPWAVLAPPFAHSKNRYQILFFGKH